MVCNTESNPNFIPGLHICKELTTLINTPDSGIFEYDKENPKPFLSNLKFKIKLLNFGFSEFLGILQRKVLQENATIQSKLKFKIYAIKTFVLNCEEILNHIYSITPKYDNNLLNEYIKETPLMKHRVLPTFDLVYLLYNIFKYTNDSDSHDALLFIVSSLAQFSKKTRAKELNEVTNIMLSSLQTTCSFIPFSHEDFTIVDTLLKSLYLTQLNEMEEHKVSTERDFSMISKFAYQNSLKSLVKFTWKSSLRREIEHGIIPDATSGGSDANKFTIMYLEDFVNFMTKITMKQGSNLSLQYVNVCSREIQEMIEMEPSIYSYLYLIEHVYTRDVYARLIMPYSIVSKDDFVSLGYHKIYKISGLCSSIAYSIFTMGGDLIPRELVRKRKGETETTRKDFLYLYQINSEILNKYEGYINTKFRPIGNDTFTGFTNNFLSTRQFSSEPISKKVLLNANEILHALKANKYYHAKSKFIEISVKNNEVYKLQPKDMGNITIVKINTNERVLLMLYLFNTDQSICDMAYYHYTPNLNVEMVKTVAENIDINQIIDHSEVIKVHRLNISQTVINEYKEFVQYIAFSIEKTVILNKVRAKFNDSITMITLSELLHEFIYSVGWNFRYTKNQDFYTSPSAFVTLELWNVSVLLKDIKK